VFNVLGRPRPVSVEIDVVLGLDLGLGCEADADADECAVEEVAADAMGKPVGVFECLR
jgi:hypothetical protein